tara:strand:- start:1026 stop:1397 length:372 start_codon:yes stop_codon:yes gene_type:complete
MKNEVLRKQIALNKVEISDKEELYKPYLLDGETPLYTFKGIRDRVIITNKRLILINIQGLTGKKKEFFFLNFSKVLAYSVENAGTLDLDSELKLYTNIGTIELAFMKGFNIMDFVSMLDEAIN